MSDGYREHRIRTSLGRAASTPASSDAEVRRLAEDVHRQGLGVFFFKDQLDAMPWQSRGIITAEAERIYGDRCRGGKKGGR